MMENNYNLPSDVYINIVATSPQIIGAKYEPFWNIYKMWDGENNYWEFKVYRDE